MKKPESVFKKKVMKKLETIHFSWWESINQIAVRGTPDIIGCINGRFIGLELKSSAKGKVSKMQEYKIEKIEESGGMAVVVHPDNFDAVFEILFNLGARNVYCEKCGRMEPIKCDDSSEFIESKAEHVSELEINETIAEIGKRSEGRGSITQIDH
jgi:hypothetical protein